MAWYAHGGINGRPLGAIRSAMKSPQTPDCRGGVFATRRFPRPPPTPSLMRITGALRSVRQKWPPRPVATAPRAIPHPGGHPARYLRGVEAGDAPAPPRSIAITNQPKTIPTWPSPSPTSPATGTAPCPSTTWWATACCCAAAPPACTTPAPPRSYASGSASGWPPDS